MKKSAGGVAGGIGGALLLLILWQLVSTIGPLAGNPGLPTASAALAQTLALSAEPAFWGVLGETLTIALTGLAIALVVGLVIGLITGLSMTANSLLDPLMQFLRPIPAVVILPLVLLVLGPTRELGVFLAAFGAVWPILIQANVGVRDVDPVALDVSRSMRLSWAKTQTVVVLPSALPYIATGVRIAASAALLLTVGAGLLAGSPGLGNLILVAQQNDQADLVWGLILWSGILGLAFAALVTALEKLLVRGRPTVEVNP